MPDYLMSIKIRMRADIRQYPVIGEIEPGNLPGVDMLEEWPVLLQDFVRDVRGRRGPFHYVPRCCQLLTFHLHHGYCASLTCFTND